MTRFEEQEEQPVTRTPDSPQLDPDGPAIALYPPTEVIQADR